MDTTTAGPDLGPALAGATRPIGYYAAYRGYDPAFLGVSVPVPVLTEEQRRNAAKNTAADPGSDDTVLPYTHFSLVMNRSRQLAYYTVVNIDGAESIELERADDKWYFDPRIAESEQIGEGLYRRNALDRGHLVRRLDPVWGDRGPRANDDTFHFTNCSPQHERFNQGQDLWQGLENFLLGHADLADQRLTVFTGPVMADDDPLYKGVRLPLAFWKIAVFRRPAGELAASAYALEQAALIHELPDLEAAFDAGMYRVTLAELGERTGLDFGYLAAHETPLDSSGLERAPTRLPIGADFANVAL
ncbi:DNA/RNA non-specific endonuclease [Pseudonocardia acaciae]|uniref:DNA/RNA non-specific endonuclease n=1 Tax=Pseudonocardia acaciae TaxID=551276 RepID=UPI000685F931|nr:DNA/RNA non-specific endonuclease [Pseudonocardia acaciae]